MPRIGTKSTQTEDLRQLQKIANLVELLSFRARADADKCAIAFIDGDEQLTESLTFADLHMSARSIGGWVASRHRRGERVLLTMPPGVAYIQAFFGCLYGGAIPVPLFPPHTKSFKAARLDAVLKDSSAELVLTTALLQAPVIEWLARASSDAVVCNIEEINDAEDVQWADPGLLSNDIAFLQYTSGSTNVPKGVMVSHGNLLHNMRLMKQRWDLGSDSTIVSWLPIFHDLGIVGNNLLGVYLGATQYLMIPQEFVKRPGAWLRAISHYQAHIAMAPNFAFRLCTKLVDDTERRELDLSSWRLAVNCGEPVVPAAISEFVDVFRESGFNDAAMTPALGMAETTLFVSGSRAGQNALAHDFDAASLRNGKALLADKGRSSRQIMSCGPIMDELTARIVDPETLAICNDGEIGELWIAGDSVTLGYWDRSQATEAAFSAYILDTSEGPFFRTGDLAFMLNEELHVCGRLKDMIIIRGQNFAPTDIEVSVEHCHPSLRVDFGVAITVDAHFEERLVVVYEIAESESDVVDISLITRSVAHVVAEVFDLQLHGFVLVERGTLPRTTSGKVTRAKTRDQLLGNELNVVAQWLHPSIHELLVCDTSCEPPVLSYEEQIDNNDHVEDWLFATLADIIGVSRQDIDRDVPFAAQGLSSVGSIELSARLERRMRKPVPTGIAYDYPTIKSLASHFAGNPSKHNDVDPSRQGEYESAVAIVGVACRFPKAHDLKSFWNNLVNGIDAVTEVDTARWDPGTLDAIEAGVHGTRLGGFVDGIDLFDPEFFGISAQEAAVMDPQHRLFLEVAWEVLESSGMTLDQIGGTNTGVFVGISSNDYGRLDYSEEALASPYDGTGNALSIAANRLSYLWDLRGPSVAIDTACSSSLVAVHMACQSLRSGECNAAIAGGVNLLLSPELTLTFSRAGMMSPAGRCRSFDDDADGYVRGEGAAAVLLKPLSCALRDGDYIHAIIQGTAINQDGRSNGLTAPNGLAQEKVIRTALQRAGVEPETVDYIEAHGSGTPLGDPIEAQALSKVFAQRKRSLLLGSVKTNIGHLEAAAGIAGLLKTTLALQHEVIPASLHFNKPNRHIHWELTPLRVCSSAHAWPRGSAVRRAGVTSFGFGGTNAHIILQESPVEQLGSSNEQHCGAYLLVLSGKSKDAARALAGKYHDALAELDPAKLFAFCASAALERNEFPHRVAVAGGSLERLQSGLVDLSSGNVAPLSAAGTAAKDAPRVACLYSGQGGAFAGMAADFYNAFPVFRKRMDQCIEWSELHGYTSLRPALLESHNDSLDQSAVSQPAQFAFQWALTELWRELGVVPAVVCGHSIGEYAAACSAGMLLPEDALRLLAERGKLMDERAEAGSMVAVAADVKVVRNKLDAYPGVTIAVCNGPEQTVIAGANEALETVAEALADAGIRCTRLKVRHAFHSELMQPMLAPFREYAMTASHAAATIPFASCAIDRCISPGEAVDAKYWTDHIEQPVDFQRGLLAVAEQGISHVLEIGPRTTLTALGQAILPDHDLEWLQQPGETASPLMAFFGALGRLYVAGVCIRWSAIYPNQPRLASHLPTYPFQRRRLWNRKPRTLHTMNDSINPNKCSAKSDTAKSNSGADESLQIGQRLANMIGESLNIAPQSLDSQSSFLEMGMDSIALIGVVRDIEREFGLRIEIRQMFETLYNLDLLTEHVVANARPAASSKPTLTASAYQEYPDQSGAMGAIPGPPDMPSLAGQDVSQDVSANWKNRSHEGQEAAIGHAGWERLMSQQLETLTHLMQSQLTVMNAVQVGRIDNDKRPVTTSALPRPSAAGRAKGPGSSAGIPAWKVAESTSAPLSPHQKTHLEQLTQRYCLRTHGSKSYAQQHRKHLADNRVVAGFRALTKEMHYPLVSKSARGARMWDIDDNEYIDVTMGFGVNLFGHNPPFVTDAMTAQLSRGIQLGPQADLAGEVAALVCELTGNERAAFVSTGTEAVMIACRLARAATRKSTIVMFSGAYHGQHDSTVVVTDPDDTTYTAVPGVPGITHNAVADTVMLTYGDEAALDYIVRHADQLAAVLVEPVQSRRPDFQPREFLQSLRTVTEEHGVALIFDEMITGFRCHPGGAQAFFDVRADIVTYGKIVGGGLPIGVVSGKRRFLDVVDGGDWQYGDDSWPAVETTFVSGTHSKHPLTLAAAYAVLTYLKEQGPGLQQRLNERMAIFAAELNAYFAEQGIPVNVPYFSSIFRITFAGHANLIYYHLLEKGVFLWEGRVYALSTAHTDDDLAYIINAIKLSVEELRDGGFLPGSGQRITQPSGHSAPPSVLPSANPPKEPYAPPPTAAPVLDFSLSFFGRYEREYRIDKYDLLFASGRFADSHGFKALWLPERHFHPFGGFSPNPSVSAAALARETRRIEIRAGSVVVPLHHPIRIAEEWALVDNLSQGRVGIAAASGWHPDDFVLAPDCYKNNRDITFNNLDTIQRLWRGEEVESIGGTGKAFGAKIFPMPKQSTLPIWVTVVKNPDTYMEAGRRGFGILTNMMGQSVQELRSNIALYRQARSEAGFDPATGIVTVLVHAYVTNDAELAQQEAAKPFCGYLSTMTGLLDSLAKNHGKETNFNALSAEDRDYLLNATYKRYLESSALIGSPESCIPVIESLIAAGVNELACFIDFGVDAVRVIESLPYLDKLRSRFSSCAASRVNVSKAETRMTADVVEEEL
jgi:iturin family lipopeptide synthetase A